MVINNLKSLKPLRRKLRATLTPAEARLWKHLQRSQLKGRKFRRQQSFGPYIVDFYCPSEGLVIELDGSTHDNEKAWQRDQRRSEFLCNLELRVLRFENRAVVENLEGVLLEIARNFRS
ncbi:MAG: endonuclease domain-containing protein [Burkholderiales bacterium]